MPVEPSCNLKTTLCLAGQQLTEQPHTLLAFESPRQHWQNVSVPDAEKLDFRDLHAFDSETAVLLTAGQPARVYRTDNGGSTWALQFEHPNKESFFDAISFFDNQHGIAMSDPVDDRVLLIETLDGGKIWKELAAQRRPLKERGEAGFASSA